jgi:hypothetical protein
MSGCLSWRDANRRCKFVVGGELDLSAAPIEPVEMLFNMSLGMSPDEIRESNIEKAADCSVLYKNNELLTSESKEANSLPLNERRDHRADQLFESGPMGRAQNDLINISGDLEVNEKSLLNT